MPFTVMVFVEVIVSPPPSSKQKLCKVPPPPPPRQIHSQINSILIFTAKCPVPDASALFAQFCYETYWYLPE